LIRSGEVQYLLQMNSDRLVDWMLK
jgi:hypothetical protein